MLIGSSTAWADPEGEGQVSGLHATWFLRNTGTDPPREAIGPLGPVASQGRSIHRSVKYVNDKKTLSGPPTCSPLTEFSRSSHVDYVFSYFLEHSGDRLP